MIKVASLIALILSVSLALFGLWGLATESGMSAFDEMAGIIPAYSLFASPIIFILSLIGMYLSRGKRDKKNR